MGCAAGGVHAALFSLFFSLLSARRVRENKVAIEEMKQLQEQLYQCYFRHAPDHYSQCKDLAMDYHRRLNWQDNIPPAGFADSESRLRRTDDGGLTFERK